MRFTMTQGGAATRAAMQNILTTTGVVAALISTLVMTALVAPPQCAFSPISSCDDAMSPGLFTTYGAIHIFNLISCLATITYVTISSLWIGVHRDDEINFFIMEYYIYSIAIPATFMSFAICGVVAAELLRVWLIYGQGAFWVGIGISVAIMIPCCWFATKLVFTTVALRKAHVDYMNQSLKSVK